jgi:hypothetical protein
MWVKDVGQWKTISNSEYSQPTSPLFLFFILFLLKVDVMEQNNDEMT